MRPLPVLEGRRARPRAPPPRAGGRGRSPAAGGPSPSGGAGSGPRRRRGPCRGSARRRTRRCPRRGASAGASAPPSRTAGAPCPRRSAASSRARSRRRCTRRPRPDAGCGCAAARPCSATFTMSWNSSNTISARWPPPSPSRSGRSSSEWSAGSGSTPRVELELRADPERAEREAEPGALEELVDARPDRALELLRVGALDPHGDVGDREHAVEVDHDRDQPLLALAVAEHAPEQARLAELARRVEPDVVAADRLPEQLRGLLVAVDDLVGRDRPRVDERVDVGDHGPERIAAEFQFMEPFGSNNQNHRVPDSGTSFAAYRLPAWTLVASRESSSPPVEGELPQPVERVRAVAGTGLEGNRYFYADGEAPPGRALTLVAAEALEEAEHRDLGRGDAPQRAHERDRRERARRQALPDRRARVLRRRALRAVLAPPEDDAEGRAQGRSCTAPG